MKLHTETSVTLSPITSLIYDYADANQWAIETIVNWLRTKPSDKLEVAVPSSFAGIRESLIHIWDTERFWLSVIKKEPAPVSYRMVPFEGTLEDVLTAAVETAKTFRDYIKSLSEEQLLEVVELDTPWVQGAKTRYEFIQHCINHSSYHRGQVVTIGHHVGFHDAPMTDFSFYLFVVKQ